MTDTEKQKIAAEATQTVLMQTIGNQAMQIAQLAGRLKALEAENAALKAEKAEMTDSAKPAKLTAAK